MSVTPSLYALTARSRGVPLGTGRGSLSTAPTTGLCSSTATPSTMPIHHNFRCMCMVSMLTPAPHILALRQHLPRAGQLRPRAIGLRTERGEFLEMHPRSRLVTGALGRQTRTVQATEAVRLLGDRGLVLWQCVGRSAKLHQQVTEEFACRRERSRGHRVLLGLILMVGGGAQRSERLLVLAFSTQGPGRGDLRLDLSLLGPVGELAFGEHLAQVVQTLDLLARTGGVTTARGAERPSEGVDGFGLRKTLPAVRRDGRRQLKLGRFGPAAALQGEPGWDRRCPEHLAQARVVQREGARFSPNFISLSIVGHLQICIDHIVPTM